MIVISSYFPSGSNVDPKHVKRLAPEMLSVELTSRQRCIAAVEFTRKQPMVYHAFCVQK